jgi:hypothetical protein
MKRYGGSGNAVPPFSTSGVVAVAQIISLEVVSDIHWLGRCVDPRTGLDVLVKRIFFFLLGFEPSVSVYRLSYPTAHFEFVNPLKGVVSSY